MDWTPERVQRFWDYESSFPERYFAFSRSGSLVKRLKRHIRGVERALDLGCGRGYLTEALLKLGIGVAAADQSPESVAFVYAINEPMFRILADRPLCLLHHLLKEDLDGQHKRENMQHLFESGALQGRGAFWGDARLDMELAQQFGLDFVFVSGASERCRPTWNSMASESTISRSSSSQSRVRPSNVPRVAGTNS
jgi:SAM-dependent methyltransferase